MKDCNEAAEVLCIKKTVIAELAIGHYGRLLQTVVAIEEMAELQKELSKAIRRDFDFENDSIAEEIADVEIMLEQLKQIFKCREAVKLWTTHKLDRTFKRIREELEADDGQSGAGCSVDKEP